MGTVGEKRSGEDAEGGGEGKSGGYSSHTGYFMVLSWMTHQRGRWVRERGERVGEGEILRESVERAQNRGGG